MIGELLANKDYQAVAPAFSADGVLQTLARYPNESEGWINITEGWMLDIVDRNWKVNPRDRMRLLLLCCKDCIGNISVREYE